MLALPLSGNPPASSSVSITVNGERLVALDEPVHLPLLDWLRQRGLTGSKQGCAEGDCGACTVALVDRDARGHAAYRAVNSCIAPLPMFHGREIVTVEGLTGSIDAERLAIALDGRALYRDSNGSALHPVQQAMVGCYGSQCGYCTPGFTVSLFEAWARQASGESLSGPRLADQLSGNLCRCTGYRPIRDAALEMQATGAKLGKDVIAADALLSRLPVAAATPPAFDYVTSFDRYMRPHDLAALCRALGDDPDAVLIGGATEIGVEINKQAKFFPCLIATDGVSELRVVERRERGASPGWWIGGAATLTDVEDALAVDRSDDVAALRKMLAVFASRQIRSRATVAGNLITASPIGDLAPVLLALDASVELVAWRDGQLTRREIALGDFFVGYRKTLRERDEVMSGIFIPDAPAGILRRVESYKVSKRRELDISIVAACFRVDLDGTKLVVDARLCYGGVAATPCRARSAEQALVGEPWGIALTDKIAPLLDAELRPLSDVRSGAPYRKGLAASLFAKFVVGGKSEAQDLPLEFTRGAPAVSDPELDEVGRALRHESAVGHVTGQAIYVDDQAHRRGRGQVLEMWPVMAPHARAKILRRNADHARAVPGVVAILFAEDIPGRNDVGAVRHDEPLLASDEISFHGQLVAVVLGESAPICRHAAGLVEVDYEPLPAILGIEDAIAASSFHTAPHHIRRGNVDEAIAASARRLNGTFSIGGQEHFYLETQAAWAERGDDGDVFVVSSTQHPSEIQAVVAHVLELPANKVVVQSPRMGGGFGGKETQGNTWAALVALAAWKTGRPTRVQLDRDLDMVLTGKRHPFRAEFEAGFEDDGRLRALRASLVSDGGWALDLSESILDRSLFHIDNGYFIPALHVQGRVAKTNLVSNTAFRGFGGPQGMLVIEEVMDRIARVLGLRPEEVRERNLYRGTGESNTTHYGQPIGDERLLAMWKTLEQSSELKARRREIEIWNAQSAQVKRGIAMTPVKFGISFTASFLNQAGALVLFYSDGSCQVNHGGTEMGQGLYTKILGIAMRELGLAATQVRLMKTQTDKVPNTSATAASAGADLNGAAVKNARRDLAWPLVAARGAHLGGARRARRGESPARGSRLHLVFHLAVGEARMVAALHARALRTDLDVGDRLLPHAGRALRQSTRPGAGRFITAPALVGANASRSRSTAGPA